MVEGALVIAVLAAAAMLFAQGLPTAVDYDEGVYLASVDALRHGQDLGTEIFTPQPPGFYEVLRAGTWLFGDSVDGGRVTIIAFALLALAAAYLLGRSLGGPASGFGAAALLTVAPPFPTFAGRISADLPALALALLSLACFSYSRRAAPLAAAAGALLAVAVSVKLSALAALVPLVALAVATRLGRRDVLLAVGAALLTGVALLLAHLTALDDLWHGVVSYHTAARDVPGPGLGENAERVARFLDFRTPFAYLVVLAAAAWLRVRRPAGLWTLWLWAGVSALFLVWHKPLHDNHTVLLAVTLALTAGIAGGAVLARLAPRRAGLLAVPVALLLLAGYAQEWRRLHRNQGPNPPAVEWAARQLRSRTAPDELVVTDRPIIAFLADRRVPGELVDAAALRFDAGFLTPHEVLAAVDGKRVRAVVAAREFREQPAVMAGLRARFPTRLRYDDVWLFYRVSGSADAS